jgi:hypothetical protein
MTTERLIPKPTGTVADITRVLGTMAHRHRETQPEVNQPTRDTVPGSGSGDQ